MELKSLQDQLSQFARERNWEQFHTIKNLVLALLGEAGELAAVVQWLETVDSEYLSQHPQTKMDLADEMADVFIYLLRLADVAQVDLVEASQRKMLENERRYTIEKSFGNAEKR